LCRDMLQQAAGMFPSMTAHAEAVLADSGAQDKSQVTEHAAAGLAQGVGRPLHAAARARIPHSAIPVCRHKPHLSCSGSRDADCDVEGARP